VTLNVIDKLVVGLVATAIVGYAQGVQRRNERILQESIAEATVVTDVVREQRQQLTDGVTDFVRLVQDVKPLGMARDASAEALRQREVDIRMPLAVLRTLHSLRGRPSCEPNDLALLDTLEDAIKDLTVPLLTKSLPPTELETRLGTVLTAYSGSLGFTSCLAVDTIHQEVRRVH
jgi:hypothetical protein